MEETQGDRQLFDGWMAAVSAGDRAAFACLYDRLKAPVYGLALLLSPGRLPGGPEASLPGEPGGTFEATGFVMKAYSPAGSASSASQAQVLSPNEAVNLPAVDCGLASMIGKTALDGDLSLYKIHLPFEVVCEGEAICAVSYRTNTGWFERRLSVSHPADLEAFAQVVDVVNRTPSGAWGYAPLGDAIRFAYENQLMAHKQLSLQLSLTARRDASEEEVEEAFHRLLNGVEIQVELTYADGSVGSTRLAFSVSDPVGEGLSATLITRAAP